VDILGIYYSASDILKQNMDTDYLPSARFVKTVLGILVAVVVSVTLYKGAPSLRLAWNEFWVGQNEQQKAENKDAFGEYRELDTDGDGLLDWEEALFGTDVDNPDSDGDGTNDYVEYRAANPAIGGSVSDVGSVGVSTEIPEAEDTFDPTNLTDALARDLYTSLSVVDQQSGGNITAEDNDKLASIAANSLQVFTSKEYTALEIRTITSPTPAQKTQFVAALNQAWIDANITPADVQSILTSINNDASISPIIIAKIPTWKSVGSSLIRIPVPGALAVEYAAYVTAAERYMSVLAAIANNDADPARAIGALVALEEALDTIERLDTSLRTSKHLQ
jgi:hypothetical protein